MNRAAEFSNLMSEWDRDTAGYSVSSLWEKHENFKKLLEFEDVIPFACLFLKRDFHRAFSLLRAALPEDKHPPALPDYYAGRLPIYREVYIYWAIKEGYLVSKHTPHEYWLQDKYGNRIE